MASGVKRRTQIGGQFAARLIEMLEAPAFRILSLSARRVLDRLEIELGSHGGTDNGKLPCTYQDFHRYGIDRHSIAPAIRELEALGFIEVTERGRAGNAEYRSPNIFRLTYKHTKYANATDEWRKVTSDRAAVLSRAARLSTKAKPSGGNYPLSMGETHTETSSAPMGETPTTAIPGKPPLLSISRGGG